MIVVLEQDGSEIKNSDYEAKLAQIRQVYQTEYGKYEQVQKTKWCFFTCPALDF